MKAVKEIKRLKFKQYQSRCDEDKDESRDRGEQESKEGISNTCKGECVHGYLQQARLDRRAEKYLQTM